MISKSEILEHAIPLYNSVFVYFLIKDSEIVYVGQTLCIESRVQHHRKNGVDFDTYSAFDIGVQMPNDVETYLIVMFKPKHNKVLSKTDMYFTESTCKFNTSEMEPVHTWCDRRWFKNPNFDFDSIDYKLIPYSSENYQNRVFADLSGDRDNGE